MKLLGITLSLDLHFDDVDAINMFYGERTRASVAGCEGITFVHY